MTYISILQFYISFLPSNHNFMSSHTHTTALRENKVLCPLGQVSTKYERVLAVATIPSNWKGQGIRKNTGIYRLKTKTVSKRSYRKSLLELKLKSNSSEHQFSVLITNLSLSPAPSCVFLHLLQSKLILVPFKYLSLVLQAP